MTRFHITIDDRPFCVSDTAGGEVVDAIQAVTYCEADGTVRKALPVCGHATTESAEAVAAVLRKVDHLGEMRVVEGHCGTNPHWDAERMTYAEEEEWIKALEIPKTQEELLAKSEELRDRVWYQRHLRYTDSEKAGFPLDLLKRALDAAEDVRTKYGDRTMYGQPMLEWDEANVRRLEGWMAALRWVGSSFYPEEDSDGLYDT